MIPVGIERDKRIAEIRDGNKWDMCSQVKEGLCLPWASDTDPCDECHRTPYRPYSTDIASAMELFAELPTGSTIYKAKDGYTIRVYFGYKERWKTLHKADDIPDAVSGAWLKFKEVDGG